jgi:hypothetical protein
MTTTETILHPPAIAGPDISIFAADAYPLGATLFEPKKVNAPLTIIAPAASP